MKRVKRLCIIVAVVLALGMAAAYAAGFPPVPTTKNGLVDFDRLSVVFGEVTSNNVAIREEPNKRGAAVITVNKGFPFMAADEYHASDGTTWYEICFTNASGVIDYGFVAASYAGFYDAYDFMNMRGETTFYRMLAESYDLAPLRLPSYIYREDAIYVYMTENGSKFHYSPVCSSMRDPFEFTLEAAYNMGRSPCSVCAANAPRSAPRAPANQTMVWVAASGTRYHSTPYCGTMNPSRATQVTLSEAKKGGYTPCSVCNPPR